MKIPVGLLGQRPNEKDLPHACLENAVYNSMISIDGVERRLIDHFICCRARTKPPIR